MAARLVAVCAWLSFLLLGSVAVDRSNFKTCSQSSFCRWAADTARERLREGDN